ncbi:MAG TPA: universal stress protein [Afifellaceae bacterium]|nr:universal stress protein [Afifellaceae bacterium]
MFKTILVPVDISQLESAVHALSLAKDMAKARGGKIVLLNVIEEVPNYIAAEIPAAVFTNSAEHTETELTAFAEREGVAGDAEIVIRRGHAARDILEFATERSADMIVMASHDPGFADYFLGSVAGHVVRHAHCSVLVARAATA